MYPKYFTRGETGIFVLAAIVFTSIIWWISAPVIEITQPNAEACLKLITSKLK